MGAPNYFKLWKSPFTISHRTTMVGLIEKCRSISDGKPKYPWSVSRTFTVWLQAEHGDKTECAIMKNVRLCDRELCVYCQWCFIAEDTDCYRIPYTFTVKVHKTIKPITSLQPDTSHCTHAPTRTCMQIVAVIKLPIFALAYNIEGLETSHRCPSHSFLLQREVCVTVQSVSLHTLVHTWTDGCLCISSCTVLYFQTVTW